MRRSALLLALALPAAACFPHPVLTADGRERVLRATAQQPSYLRVAVYVSPFFGDSSRVLLTDRPAAEVAALRAADGKPIASAVPERILPPGTPLFVTTVQFPTGAALFTRPPSSPRFSPWLLAVADGEERTAVILLSAQAETVEDLLAEIGRYLTSDDPGPAFRALPDGQRTAVLKKELVDGMGRDAALMAWGYPERIVLAPQARTEEWFWPQGRRHALFQDDRLVRYETAQEASPEP
ncbi:MAG TPA: hypothetical protein VMK42_01705 [Anaeromyxobacteraceae bacterium]|nr:hypothetical protein [Anaeromyxobacteraceae bacterium]